MLTNQTIDPTKQHTPESRHVLIRPFIRVWEWFVPSSVAARDRQSPMARMIGIFLVVSVSITLLLVGILYAKPIQDAWQSSQAERMIADARYMMENGQSVNGYLKAQEAFHKAPHSVEAMRFNADIFTKFRPETALYFGKLIQEKGAENLEDKMRRVRALKNLNRDKEATAELEKLLRVEQTSVPLMVLAEEMWGQRQQNGALLSMMKDFCKKNPEDHESGLRLAKVQISSNLPTEVSSGIDAVWKLAQRDDAVGLKAIEFFDGLPTIPTEYAKPYIQRLKTHPKGDDRHYIAALKHEVRLFPDRKRAIIAEGKDKFRDKKRDELNLFIRWLVEEEQFLDVVTFLTEEDAKAHEGLLGNYLSALTMLGMAGQPDRFKQMERIVEDPAVAKVLDTTTHAMFRAHLAYVTKQPSEELRAKLIDAMHLAEQSSRFPSLQKIAEYAEARGHFDIAEDAYRRTVRTARRANTQSSPRIERDALKGLIKACENNGHSDALFHACQDAITRFPEDPDFMDRFIYASLLLGNDVETGLNNAKKLLRTQPKDSQRRLAVALAHWRLQDKDQALQFLQYMDLNVLTEGQRAVFAAIASSAGFGAQAVDVIKAINPRAVMYPEERRCYDRALKQP